LVGPGIRTWGLWSEPDSLQWRLARLLKCYNTWTKLNCVLQTCKLKAERIKQRQVEKLPAFSEQNCYVWSRCSCPCARHWGVEVEFHLFLISALDWSEWSSSRPNRRKLSGRQIRSVCLWRAEKKNSCLGRYSNPVLSVAIPTDVYLHALLLPFVDQSDWLSSLNDLPCYYAYLCSNQHKCRPCICCVLLNAVQRNAHFKELPKNSTTISHEYYYTNTHTHTHTHTHISRYYSQREPKL
jgi:hypothetical protein